MQINGLAILVGIIAVGAGFLLVPAQCEKMEEARLQAELKHELEAARREGIPITVAEFEATLPVVKPEDNAAPIYAQIAKLKEKQTGPVTTMANKLLSEPSPKVLQEGRQLLVKESATLDLGKKGAKLSGFRADREWSQGAGVIFPDLTGLIHTMKLLTIEGALAAESNPAEALESVRALRSMAGQLKQEPAGMSHLMAMRLETYVVRNLGTWAIRHPAHRKVYLAELKAVAESFKEPDMKAVWRLELYSALHLLEQVQTKEGRAQIGLREEDVKQAAEISSAFRELQPVTKGKTRVVKGFRQIWKSLDGPEAMRRDEKKAGLFEMYQGLMSYPLAGQVHETLGGGPADLLEAASAKHVMLRGLVRALEGSTIPKSIRTDDLVSPLDGKPIRYTFDGKRIEINAGADSEGVVARLILPPRPQ